MRTETRLKQKEVTATKKTSSRVVASSLQVVNDLVNALKDPNIAKIPACIKKKGEKARDELSALQEKAKENLESSDPEPWEENIVKEWPVMLGTWKSICEILSNQCELLKKHA